MPHYLYRWQMTHGSVKAMVEKPQDRAPPARALIESFGGKMECYYFVAGEYDGIAIAEMPDTVSAAALSLRAASTGGFTRFETTLLLTTQEAEAAMKKAGGAGKDYKPPGG